MNTLLQDLRYALRTLRANPGFTTVAVIALAIGIGANTSIFSVVNAILLRPLPYSNPGQLVLIQERIPKLGQGYMPVSAPDVLDFQKQTRALAGVAGFENGEMNASGSGEPLRIKTARVTANLFPILGASPSLGRTFTNEEDQPGRLVAVLSYGLWQRLFGGDSHAIGSSVMLDGKPHQVLGVMPRSFVFPPPGLPWGAAPAELWVPMAFTHDELSNVVDNFDIGVIGRTKAGFSSDQANADINRVAHFIQEKYAKEYTGGFTLEARALALPELVVGNTRTLVLILLGAVAFVLLIACANVANLLLSRAASRRREIAIRTALGARRVRLVRQFLTESLILALLGGVLGVALAWWGLQALVALMPASIPVTSEINVDLRVLSFAAALSLLTGVVFGLFPALSASRGGTSTGLNETGRSSTAGKQRNRLRSVLATAEVALALVLVVGAGLLIRSFAALRNTDPGFRPEHALSIFVALPDKQYAKAAAVRSFDQAFLGKIGALPGVHTVGAASTLPLARMNWNQTILKEGRTLESPGKVPIAWRSVVMGDYFQALGIALKRGRYFTDADRIGSPEVVIVSEALARDFWPNREPIGKRVKFGGQDAKVPWKTVVGVVADVKQSSIEAEAQIQFYTPIAQVDDDTMAFIGRNMNYVMRTSVDPASLSPAVRLALRSLDNSLPVAGLQTMQEVVDTSTAPRRFNTWLMGLLAAIALLIAAVGIYGVMAYSVTMRTQEIGIRMALGAARTNVLRIVLRQALLIAGAGIAIGLAASFALTRFMAGLLYEIKPADPLTFAVVSLFLAAIAILAACFPALRAMRVDPMVALRHE
jgi:predicted permease